MDNAASRSEGAMAFTSVPIEITVSVGKARPLVRDLLQLAAGSVLSLDKQLDDPVELYVGEKLIGIGVLEVSEADGQGQLSVRLTEVSDLNNPS
ncbi:FliM/FliN family flagellar motor switch protein [Pelagimonas varians]|uniref:Flagellar motor switch protein FliN n=1 Tax=Pelagimonas varians TaxID=696760 RepID=A0A238KAU0_9RHOB|nr:FliM/FliN family flagellar motor C-terminal domain-containing protein [Pelagimonas varians]PYG31064.1 flagellar motor switch protein FliN/FliY [Pelagimonas varians]SMX39564.1 flagellar motor switch protein [Pelagimonas varians]